MYLKKVFSLLFLSFLPSMLFCQPVDTLALARELRLVGKTRPAAKLLQHWTIAHPTDANAFWLAGQNAYWRKNYRKTRQHYSKAMSLDPANLYLKLDYAEALLGMGRYRELENLLAKIPTSAQNDPHFHYINAKHLFWKGDFSAAENFARIANSSGSLHAPELLREIELARAPQLVFFGNYEADTQPLEKTEPGIEAVFSKSKWLDLRLQAVGQRFLSENATFDFAKFDVGNRFHFVKTGTTVGVSAGIFAKANASNGAINSPSFTTLTADLQLTQRLPFGLKIKLTGARKPYLHTRSSLDTCIFFRRISGELEWQEPHGFWAQVGVLNDVFEDENQVQTAWAWLLSPPLKAGRISVRAGYAFSHSDSKYNRYFSEKSLPTLLNPWDSTAQIKGVYAPYFTPENMNIHAALGLLQFDISKRISLIVNGKYGFYATADNPYLFLDVDSIDAVFIQREFQNIDFSPLEISTKLSVQFSERISAVAHWVFTRNLFYESHVAGAQLKWIF